MPEELSPEAAELLSRLKAAQDLQRADHAGTIEAIDGSLTALARLKAATDPAVLPGRWKYRMIVFGAVGSLIENIRSLRKELTAK